MKIEASYGITKRIPNVDLEVGRQRVTAALAAEGFGVLTEIDLQKTLKNKLGVDIEPYLVLGACNPKLAHRALGKDPAVGLLLPCNVVLTKDGSDLVVAAVSPKALFGLVEAQNDLQPIADEAEQRIRRAVEQM